MADEGVRVESVEAALRSEISISSAKMMKDQYRHDPAKKSNLADPGVFTPPSENPPTDDVVSGPDALISITKISTRTSREEIKKLLREDPGREEHMKNHDFYTIIFVTRIRMEDPSTTRFINAFIQFVFPPLVKILNYSPSERGVIPGLIKAGGTGILTSPALDFKAVSFRETGFPEDTPQERFEFISGTDTKITGMYSKKCGFYLGIPPPELFEYMAMLKNDHEVYGEVYPPMPLFDGESSGKENLAVFPLIIQTPRDILPEIRVHVDGKVKGAIWGVIHLKSRITFSKN
jgi:hypothetical protein